MTESSQEGHDVAYSEDASPILNGIPTHLPDIDPAETQEWLESLDSVIDGDEDVDDVGDELGEDVDLGHVTAA